MNDVPVHYRSTYAFKTVKIFGRHKEQLYFEPRATCKVALTRACNRLDRDLSRD